MSISAADLTAARRQAEELMTDTVDVSYDTGDTIQDPDTGSTVPEYAPRFTSRCKVQARNLQARAEEVGGRTATTVSLELHLPVDAPAVSVGDLCTITAVGPLSDPQLVGRKLRVIAPVGKSFATARRLDVEEVVS